MWRVRNDLMFKIHVDSILTYKHQRFPVKSRQFNHLLVGNHIQLVKNCKKNQPLFLKALQWDETSESLERKNSLELCLARYLSLHFFFFPKGLQDWLPVLALLLLATLLRHKTEVSVKTCARPALQ